MKNPDIIKYFIKNFDDEEWILLRAKELKRHIKNRIKEHTDSVNLYTQSHTIKYLNKHNSIILQCYELKQHIKEAIKDYIRLHNKRWKSF